MYKKISDYGIIGNLRTVALIGLDASIDWLCFPYIDSPSVFGALLDDRKGGRFSFSPTKVWDSTSEYLPETNILRTRFRTMTGEMELVDFMPTSGSPGNGLEPGEHELCRRLTVTLGSMDVGMVFEPRFDYAKSVTSLRAKRKNACGPGWGQGHDPCGIRGYPGRRRRPYRPMVAHRGPCLVVPA